MALPITLAPLLLAPPAIQAHVLAATLALTLGPLALYRRRRDRWHRLAGRAWVAAMAAAALSSFAISDMPVLGPFSPIHILSLITLGGLWRGVALARAGRIGAHRRTMTRLFWGALVGAGLFTLLPGRRMNQVLFPEAPQVGLGLIAAILVTALGVAAMRRWRSTRPA